METNRRTIATTLPAIATPFVSGNPWNLDHIRGRPITVAMVLTYLEQPMRQILHPAVNVFSQGSEVPLRVGDTYTDVKGSCLARTTV